MSDFGYTLPYGPCQRDGKFTSNFGPQPPSVANRPADFRVAPRFGCARWSRLTGKNDPNRSYGEAGFAEAVDNLFEILRVLIGQDLAPLID